MLRKIRIALAIVFWLGITLLFLDFTGALHGWLGWMAKIQQTDQTTSQVGYPRA